MKTTFNLALAFALVAALGSVPAEAQGNGKKHRGSDNDRDRYEQRDRDRDRDRDDDDDDRPRFERRDDRRTDARHDSRASQQRRVPPGWCRGQGNPHNTAANCRYNNDRSRWERYDSRTRRYETYDTYNRNRTNGGSYEEAHRSFHYSHDRQCRERAAQRPLDVRWQVQVRSECKAAHDDFHRRAGTSHR
jgi:hypothetical protein